MEMPSVFDAVEVGGRWEASPFTVSAGEIVAFAQEYDAQPMHIDAVAAAAGPFGGLIASGWHLTALVMRQIVAARPFAEAPIVGLGVNELRWLHPVRPGDTLRVLAEVVGKQPSRSRPGRGVVETKFELMNQDGVVAMRMITLTLVG